MEPPPRRLAINCTFMKKFKGIVSRDFEGLKIILIDRTGVPDVPLKVYSFLNLSSYCFLIFKFTAS